jgi:putative flavoprotein involved in K+ transport
METSVETLIVGAGQAGLALSRYLTDLGRDHVVLERHRVAERWRSERWDSFRLLTPNWLTRLPGMSYDGADPDGFMTRAEVVAFFDTYARSFDAPVRTGVTVSRVSRESEHWVVETDAGRFVAANVVVATGHHDQPRVPEIGRTLPPHIAQLHSSRYRNPAQLPPGGVLVVGAGPSGQQIADELARSGRRVVIAAGRHRSLPRRYRGLDTYQWMDRLGAFERTVDDLPDPSVVRRAPAFVLAGGRDDLDLRRLVAAGAVPVGRLTGIDGSTVRFSDDLAATVAAADDNARRFRASIDDLVARMGLRVDDPEAPPRPPGRWAATAPTRLHLDHDAVRTVLWATGYRRDFTWLHAPVLDTAGEPVQHRGVTPAPGLYFLGLRWMHRRSSDAIHGVGTDAAFLAEQIACRRSARLIAA